MFEFEVQGVMAHHSLPPHLTPWKWGSQRNTSYPRSWSWGGWCWTRLFGSCVCPPTGTSLLTISALLGHSQVFLTHKCRSPLFTSCSGSGEGSSRNGDGWLLFWVWVVFGYKTILLEKVSGEEGNGGERKASSPSHHTLRHILVGL